MKINPGKLNKLDILIKLGRTRMIKIAVKVGIDHPRVLMCSQWLDKRIYAKSLLFWNYRKGVISCLPSIKEKAVYRRKTA